MQGISNGVPADTPGVISIWRWPMPVVTAKTARSKKRAEFRACFEVLVKGRVARKAEELDDEAPGGCRALGRGSRAIRAFG